MVVTPAHLNLNLAFCLALLNLAFVRIWRMVPTAKLASQDGGMVAPTLFQHCPIRAPCPIGMKCPIAARSPIRQIAPFSPIRPIARLLIKLPDCQTQEHIARLPDWETECVLCVARLPDWREDCLRNPIRTSRPIRPIARLNSSHGL